MITANSISAGGSGSSGTTIDAYAYVDATSGTPTIQKSNNVSSITDGGVGIYTVNFTSALASANYSWAGSGENLVPNEALVVIYEAGTRSTTALPVRVSNTSSTAYDTTFSVIVTGA
jgi:hypothetical protein